jgi:hypothetical protein
MGCPERLLGSRLCPVHIQVVNSDFPDRCSCAGCGLVLPRAVPRFHRDRRHPSSPGRGRDRSCDDDDKEPYPSHDRGTEACSVGRDREAGRDGDRCLLVEKMGDRACSFPGLRVGLDDPQEDHPGPRGPLPNVDSLLEAGRIPCFRLLSRRQLALARQRERHDPGDLAVERPPRDTRGLETLARQWTPSPGIGSRGSAARLRRESSPARVFGNVPRRASVNTIIEVIEQAATGEQGARVAEHVMRALPEWFGLEESLLEYVPG